MFVTPWSVPTFVYAEVTCRHTEVNLKKELNMQADVKRAEIGLVQRILRRTLLTNFIQTSAGPPLFWLPGKHNTATQSLLKKEQEKLEAYKVWSSTCELHTFVAGNVTCRDTQHVAPPAPGKLCANSMMPYVSHFVAQAALHADIHAT